MSGKPKLSKLKQIEKQDEKREATLEEMVDEDVQPWKNIFRPTCALPPKDNSFTLEDEAVATAAENAVSSFTVSDPNEQGNPLCYVSPGFVSMTGYSVSECVGRNCQFLQGGQLDSATQELLRANLAERRVATLEVTNYRKDGRAFQNLLTLAPVLGGDGATLLHFVGVQCDLDERRRRGETVDDAFVARWQEQLRQGLSAFALVDVSGGGTSGISVTSGGGVVSGAAAACAPLVASRGSGVATSTSHPPTAAVCAVSPGFSTLTGYSQSDVIGWNLLCLCGPESSERDMRKLITSQWSHTPTAVKLLCYKRDGTPFWALVLSYPLSRTPVATAAPASVGPGLVSAASQVAAGPAGRITVGAAASGRNTQVAGGAQGRATGLGLGLFGGGLLGGAAASGSVGFGLLGGLSSNTVGLSAASGIAASTSTVLAQPTVKYCLCCVVDITAQRLKKVVGGKYVLGKVIGAGAFGLVRIGKNTSTEELVAVKGVDATRFRNISELDQIQEEMSVLSSLKHPNIIRLYDVHFQSNTFFLVMEFAGNGSLVHFMRSQGDPVRHCLDEATAARVFVQMVGALDYCHRRRVVHRDLKPENILVDEHNNLKIADFGLAAVAAPFSGGLTLQCGTPEFTAPEITNGREYDGPSVDIWSMGVILYETLTGNLPFKGANQAALFKAIQKGTYEPLPALISQECKDLVRRMLAVDPSTRIKMEDILRHPWVTRAIAAGSRSTWQQGGIGSPMKPDTAACDAADAVATEALPVLRYSNSDGASAASGPTGISTSASGNCLGEGSRPGSTARHGGVSTAGGGGSRGGRPSNISDGCGPATSQLSSNSRPSSAGIGGVMLGQGSQSPAAPPMLQAPNADESPSGVLHDSVKLVIPSQVDRDDPILAAILRSHANVGMDATSQSPPRAPGDDARDGEPPLQQSSQTCGTGPPTAGVSRRDPAPSSASSSTRVGPSGRSMGGVPGAGAGSLHGQNQGNGKPRGGALLPTLGGTGANGPVVLDRRLQDPTRFRSPARVGQTPGPGGGVRGGAGNVGTPGARIQVASQAGAPPSPHAVQSPHGIQTYVPTEYLGRQLPPIQNSRALGKKSSWMPGS